MYRLSALLIGLSVFAVGCSDSNPNDPSPGTMTTTFTVPLSAANEVPAIVNADANATGTATITLTITKNGSGAITAATADFQITVAGFPAGAVITDAHIHNAPAGANGGVFVNTTLAAGDLTLTNGAGTVTKTGINVPADRAAAILNNPTGHYFNVHTVLNPAGAIRGQFVGAPVPY